MTDLTNDAPISASAGDKPSGLASAQHLDLDQFEALHIDVQSWQTTQGSRVKFVEARGLPMLDLTLRFRAGTSQDEQQRAGLAALTLHMLSEGSNGLDASQHAERIERLGAIVRKDVRLDHVTLHLRTLSSEDNLDAAVELFTDLVAAPDFPPQGLDKIKNQWAALYKARLTSQGLRPRIEVYRHLFKGHPYATPLGSTQDGIDTVTVDDLRAFHRKAYAAPNLDMVLVGDLSRDQAEALAQRISQALPQSWAATELPPVPEALTGNIHVEQSTSSVEVLLALPVQVPPTEPDYLALELATLVLESRLMEAMRERLTLTYSVRAELKSLTATGLFSVQWNVNPEYLQGSIAQVETLLQRFIEDGPSDVELQLARQQLAGRLLRDISRNQTLAERLIEMSSRHLPDNHLTTRTAQLAELSRGSVREVAKRRLDLSRKAVATVGSSVEQKPLPILAVTG